MTFDAGVIGGMSPGGEWPQIIGTAFAPDGRIYVGGHFNQIAFQARPGLARLMPEGSLDPSFRPIDPSGATFGFDAHQVWVQPSGKLIAGWGCSRRYEQDGSLDNSFQTRPPAGDCFGPVALYPDGRWLGLPNRLPSRLLRADANGQVDLSFGSQDGPLFDSSDSPFVIQPDGKTLGVSRFTLMRLEAGGNVDKAFIASVFATDGPATPLGIRTQISSILLQPDGRICVGGYFQTVNGTACAALARFNPDGSLDKTFNPPPVLTAFIIKVPDESTRGPAVTLTLQANGKLIVAGAFQASPGAFAGGITRLNTDGSLDRTFNAGTGIEFASFDPATPRIWRVLLQTDGKIVISGLFSGINGIRRSYIARLHGDPPLEILPRTAGLSAGRQLQFQLQSSTTRSVIIEATTNLARPAWLPIATNVVGTNTAVFTDTNSVNYRMRFYRAIAQ
jgi:uncharacterized delta-60 repeat protein